MPLRDDVRILVVNAVEKGKLLVQDFLDGLDVAYIHRTFHIFLHTRCLFPPLAESSAPPEQSSVIILAKRLLHAFHFRTTHDQCSSALSCRKA